MSTGEGVEQFLIRGRRKFDAYGNDVAVSYSYWNTSVDRPSDGRFFGGWWVAKHLAKAYPLNEARIIKSTVEQLMKLYYLVELIPEPMEPQNDPCTLSHESG